MRKTLIALLFATTLPAVAMAMPEDGRHHGGAYGGQMFKQLDLSKEQHRAVGKLMREQMTSRRDITQRFLAKLPATEQKAMQDELTAAKSKNQQAIRALLKPEQQKEYDAALQKMTERHAEMAEFQAWKAQRGEKAQ